MNFKFKIFALFVGLALANFDESKVGFNLFFSRLLPIDLNRLKMYSCYECESKRDTTNDVSASCWAVDGISGKEEAKCHGCYVSRTEESTEEGTGSFLEICQ